MLNLTQVMMRINACLVRMTTSLFRFARQISGDGGSGIIETQELVIDEDTEKIIVKALLEEFKHMLEAEHLPKTSLVSTILTDVMADVWAVKVENWSATKKVMLGLTATPPTVVSPDVVEAPTPL